MVGDCSHVFCLDFGPESGAGLIRRTSNRTATDENCPLAIASSGDLSTETNCRGLNQIGYCKLAERPGVLDDGLAYNEPGSWKANLLHLIQSHQMISSRALLCAYESYVLS